MAIESLNPASGEILERFTEATPATIDQVLAESHTTFQRWRRTTFAERAGLMREAARILRDDKARYGRTMALEMGKPIAQGEGEAEKCAWVCDYYAENAEAFLAAEPKETDGSKSYVRFDPLGPVLAIMPWNFPFWQVFRFAAPALMAGNTGVLKHASNVPRCALDIEEVFRRAGFPDGAFRTLLVGNAAVAGIIGDPRIVATTLTGSEQAGMKVAEQSGRNL
jgi:succinate-semialdehyde dehydrogenase/glutarate-semialdehyde dehydrogenase